MLEEQEPIELIKDQGSREKGEKEVTTPANFQTYIRRRRDVSTGSSRVSTASRQDGSADVCTASEIGSTAGEKEKDKVKAIMTEAEPEKKIKLQQRQERSSLEAPIRLEEEFNEEETKRITKDAEIAKQLQEEIDIAGKKEAVTKDDEAHDIDWSDPSVIRYHALQNRPRSVAEVRKNMIMYLKNHGGYKMKDFKGMSYNDIRPIFEKVWDQVHSFVPMNSEEDVQRLKRAGQDVEAEPVKRQRTEEVSESVQEQTNEEPKTDKLSQEHLNQMVIIVPYVEALQTKYPIIGWKVHSEDIMQFWKITRVGNHTEVYQVFEDVLKNFNRDDLVKLWILVQ
ncbi:hypothetical protein Tco_1060610 [Tanacetum coccineum]